MRKARVAPYMKGLGIAVAYDAEAALADPQTKIDIFYSIKIDRIKTPNGLEISSSDSEYCACDHCDL